MTALYIVYIYKFQFGNLMPKLRTQAYLYRTKKRTGLIELKPGLEN